MNKHVVVDIQYVSGNKSRIICPNHQSIKNIHEWYLAAHKEHKVVALNNYKGGITIIHLDKIDSIDIYEAFIKNESNPLNHNYGEDEVT